MSTKLTVILSAILILAMLLAGVVLWNQVPAQMASHWNAQDQVDGTTSRFWGLFMLPLMSLGLALLLLAIPSIDPLKKNISQFRGYFNAFIVLFLVFMAYVHALTLLWNLGHTNFKFSSALLPAMGLLFIFVGFMIRNAKRNFFIGIRTPWTLSSDTVWQRTHRLGSWLFIAAGVITLLCAFVPAQAFVVMMTSILAAALIPIIYSYLLWRREEHKSS